MQPTIIQKVFDLSVTASAEDWQLSALRINRSHETTEYETHTISLSPADAMAEYLKEMRDRYVGGEEPLIDDNTDVVEHDGCLHETPVEHLPSTDAFFAEDYGKLCHAMENPEVNGSPLDLQPNALALRYAGKVSPVKQPIYLLFKKTPFSIFKNRFWRRGDVFSRLTDVILTLPTQIDLMIVGRDVFIFTSSGSGIATDNAAARKVAERELEGLSKETFIAGASVLQEVGGKRKNARLFRAMNEGRKSRLRTDKKFCAKMADAFGIPCRKGVLEVSDPADAERLLKLLCMRGMIDPFAESPVEVSGSVAWKKGK